MTNPIISFIIAAYQEPERTWLCLEAIARQIYPHYEVIISCDSERGAPDLRERYGLVTQQVCEVVGHPLWVVRDKRSTIDGVEVRNIPAVANQGAAAARGDILCFLQQDHIILPDYGLWLARCFSPNSIMFGLMDRRDEVTVDDLNSLVRNLHIPETQIRYDVFLDQGRRLLVYFDDWRMTDGFDFAIARDRWIPMDETFVGPSHAILDAMLKYRFAGLRYVINPLMRLWHIEHPLRDPESVDEYMAKSYRKMQDKWGEDVWTSIAIPTLYDFREPRRVLQEKFR